MARARCFLRMLAAGAILLLMLPAARAAEASVAGTPTGDRDGVALLARVENAYRSVPGVKIRLGPLTAMLALRSGVVVAEEATVGPHTYVSRDGRTTYIDVKSRSCWLRSQGITLDSPGTHFPLSYRTAAVQAPHRVICGWTVRMTTESETGVHAVVELRIKTPSHLVQSVLVTEGGKRLTEQVTDLPVQPKVPTPRPLC
jgi:hypothetical protein